MADFIERFLHLFTDNDILLTFLSSFFPLIELKGAIPIGTKLGLSLPEAALYSYLGSTLVVIPLFFLLVPVFILLKKIPVVGTFFLKLEATLKDKAASVAKKTDGADGEKQAKRIILFALFAFVAVPLPLTGIWTGTAIAVFLGLKFRESVLPLALGNLVAGCLITLMTFIFKEYVDIVIDVIFIIAVIMLAITIFKVVKAKPKDEDKKG